MTTDTTPPAVRADETRALEVLADTMRVARDHAPADAVREAAITAVDALEVGFIVCDQCSHEIPTADMDAAVTLRDALAPTAAGRDAGSATTAGAITWHSSEEDGGPDVGITLGLGNGVQLWLGELLEREGGGVGFVAYGPDKREIASLSDWEQVRDVIEFHVAPAIRLLARAALSTTEPAGEKG